ncbi:MAG: Xaa-Pro dipeptidase [Kofleriaceae bacterium]
MDLASLYAQHAETLAAGTAAALEACGYDAVILAGGRAATRNRFDDQDAPLSPTPAFSHWVPVVEADALLVIEPGQRPTLHRTLVDDFWHAPARLELDHVGEQVARATRRAGDALALPRGRVAVISRDDADDGVPAELPRNPPALLAALDALRVHKTPYELACLRLAQRGAARGHQAAAAAFAAGDASGPSELALHLAYLAASGQDPDATPYKGIVALGANAAVLHYTAYQATAPGVADTSLLVDAGARHLGYGADITRTYARGAGAAARRFADLIARVDELQQTVCAEVRPGVAYEDLHERTHVLLAELGRAAGLLRGGTEELVARGVTRALLPHGLGHSLGIVTHDVGCRPRPPRPHNPFLRMTIDLAVGHVVTIEPGLYFIPSLLAPLRADDRAALVDWDAIAELAPFGGIRIEDDVAVTADGHENLTRDAFAELAPS